MKQSNFFIFLVFIYFCSSVGISSTLPQYLLGFMMLAIWIAGWALSRNRVITVHFYDLLPMAIIFCWVYGFTLGLYRENQTSYVYANFAGMFLYILYMPLVYMKIDKSLLINVILYAGIINILYALYFWIMSDPNNPPITDIESLNNGRIYYSGGLFLLYPCISVLLAGYLIGHRKTNIFPSLFYLCSAVFCLTYLSMSKGFLAALVFLTSIYILITFISLIGTFKISRLASLFLTGILFASIYMLITTDVLQHILFLFSDQEVSNSARSEQRGYLMSEYAFWGKGLGAVLESGYNRGDEAAYGFELSYENLIHKIGVLAVIPFSIYIFILYKSFLMILRRKNLDNASCAFGAMMYLIPSYGNPMLFSPVGVLLTCISIYLLRPNNLCGKSYVQK